MGCLLESPPRTITAMILSNSFSAFVLKISQYSYVSDWSLCKLCEISLQILNYSTCKSFSILYHSLNLAIFQNNIKHSHTKFPFHRCRFVCFFWMWQLFQSLNWLRWNRFWNPLPVEPLPLDMSCFLCQLSPWFTVWVCGCDSVAFSGWLLQAWRDKQSPAAPSVTA